MKRKILPLLMCAFVALPLAACGSEKAAEEEAVVEDVAIEEEEPAAEDSSAQSVTIAEDDVCTITLATMDDNGGTFYHYRLTIANNTAQRLMVTSVADAFSVNGVAIAPIVLEVVGPDQILETEMVFFYNDDLPDASFFEGATLTGELSVYDDDDPSIKLGAYPFEITWEK